MFNLIIIVSYRLNYLLHFFILLFHFQIAKSFVIAIYDIQGFPANSGSGEASRTAGNLTVTVSLTALKSILCCISIYH